MASARPMLPESDLLEVLGRAFVALHERAAAYAGKSRWAGKNPENALRLARWQRLFGDNWLFVHAVRNPLDTLASIKEVKFAGAIPAELSARIAFYQRYTQAGLDFGEAIIPLGESVARLDTIPGVGRRTVEVLIAEIGLDMGRFSSAGHLASWAGMCPGKNESAGKHKSTKIRKGSPWLRTTLTEAALAAICSRDTALPLATGASCTIEDTRRP